LLFPQLKDRTFGHVNLEKEVAASIWKRKVKGRNQLLNPEVCQELIDDIHRRYQLAWSYGGWMENRPRLWADSYLEQEKKYLHLGVDYNVPAGTEVAVPWESEVVAVDHDQDREGGWGGRVILRPLDKRMEDNLFIFAHLSDDIAAQVNSIMRSGKILGTVGLPDVNGGWFSHLHIQAITRLEFERAMENNLADLDGYGRLVKKRELAVKYPDPTKYIPFK
jgi:murein DD-endopeptidase MepM/ murein hydrolase activator NlpD